MANIEESEAILVLRQTQDTFDISPPVSVHLNGMKKAVDVGRVQVAWEIDPDVNFAALTLVGFNAAGDGEPFISHTYPVLLDVFKALVDKTRPPSGAVGNPSR